MIENPSGRHEIKYSTWFDHILGLFGFDGQASTTQSLRSKRDRIIAAFAVKLIS